MKFKNEMLIILNFSKAMDNQCKFVQESAKAGATQTNNSTKISKSLKHMKLGQNFVKHFVRFLGNGVSRKIAFEIY